MTEQPSKPTWRELELEGIEWLRAHQDEYPWARMAAQDIEWQLEDSPIEIKWFSTVPGIIKDFLASDAFRDEHWNFYSADSRGAVFIRYARREEKTE